MSYELRIETQNLILRKFEVSDWEAVHEYAQLDSVVQHQVWGPNDEILSREFIRRARESAEKVPRMIYEFAITKKDGTLVGGCGLYLRGDLGQKGEIGFTLNPKYWGNGIAAEASVALLDLGFEKLSLNRIFATTRPENIQSVRVLEKIGMRLEGHFREDIFLRGVWRDTLIFALLSKDRNKIE